EDSMIETAVKSLAEHGCHQGAKAADHHRNKDVEPGFSFGRRRDIHEGIEQAEGQSDKHAQEQSLDAGLADRIAPVGDASEQPAENRRAAPAEGTVVDE